MMKFKTKINKQILFLLISIIFLLILKIDIAHAYVLTAGNSDLSTAATSFYGHYGGALDGTISANADGGSFTDNGHYYYAKNRYFDLGRNININSSSKITFIMGGWRNTYKAYVSSDGSNWTEVGRKSLSAYTYTPLVVEGANINKTVRYLKAYSDGATDTFNFSIEMNDSNPPRGNYSLSNGNFTKRGVTIYVNGDDSESGIKGITLPSGSFVGGTSASYYVSNNGVYTFKITDNAENSIDYQVNVTNIDRSGPTLNITPESTNWTNGGVKVNAIASDSQSGVTKIQTPDGNIISGNSVSFIIGSNGTYAFTAYDYVGNSTTNYITINCIDKNAPEMNISNDGSIGWNTKDININIAATDTESGIKNIILPNGQVINSSSTTYTVSSNGTYTFKSTDNVGNVSTKTVTIGDSNDPNSIKIDKVAPTINASYNVPSGWTNQNVEVTIAATDTESGVKNIILPNGQVINSSSATYSVPANGAYTFKSTDNVGNVSTKTLIIGDKNDSSGIKIDKTAPTINTSYNVPGGWTNQNVVVTIAATDTESGVKNIILPNGTVVSGSSTTYTVPGNGTYIFKSTDNIGNVSTKTLIIGDKNDSSSIKIDKAAPTINTNYNISSGWTNQDVVINVNATDSESGVKNIILPNGTVVNGSSTTYTVSGNGTYTFKSTDNVGNVSTKTITIGDKNDPNGIKIDKTGSTINASYNVPNGWTNKNVVVTITATDTESGVKNIVLPDGTTVNSSSTTYTVQGNGTYTFKSIDNVGNVSTKTITIGDPNDPNGIRIDKTTPTINTNYNIPSGWTNQDVVINISATDGQSGVENIILPDGTVVNGSNTTYTVQGNGTYTFKSTDNVGNVSTKTVTIGDPNDPNGIKIDKTSPTINASYNVPKGWTKDNIKIIVNSTDSQSGVRNIILPDGTAVNGSTTIYEVSENGAYIFKSTDNVGNISTKTIIVGPNNGDGSDGVKIDKNPPALIITSSTTELTNQNITINVDTQDSESGDVQIKLPNGDFVKTDKTSFVISQNGTYTVVAKDAVGNIIEKTITIDNINKVKPNKPSIGNGDSFNNGGIDSNKWNNSDVVVNIPQSTIDYINKNGSHIEYRIKDKNTGEVIQVWDKFIPGQTKINVDGDLQVDFVIVDKYGNASDPTSIYMKIDKGSPILKLIPSTTELTDKAISIHIKANDSISKVEKVILPNGNVSTQTEFDYTVNKNGLYEFIAIDSAGNKITRNYLVRNIGRKPLITNNPNVILNLKSDDYLSGTTSMKFKNENNAWNGYENYVANKNWTLSNSDGLKHVWVQYKDAANNESQAIEDTIILDTTPATIDKFTINDGKYYTNNEVVNINVKANDNLTGVNKLLISNNGVNWTTMNYTENFKWTIPLGDGEKTVYLKVEDVAGNISNVYATKVYLDKTKPTAGIIINNGDTYTASRDVKLTINFQDGQSGIDKVRIIEDDKIYEFPTVPNSPTTINWTLGLGEYRTVSIQVVDKAGNVSDLESDDILVDKLKIEDFTLSDVVNPIVFNESNPYKPLTWNFEPQHMLAGANISFDLRVKLPIDESVVKESANYKLEIIDDSTNYHQVIMSNFSNVRKHIYSETMTLPKDAPNGAKVFISCEAIRKLSVSPFDTQYDYFPGTEKSTKAQIGVIDRNIREVIKFNEMR